MSAPTTQVNIKDIVIGPATLYIAPTAQVSLASAIAATNFQKIGYCPDGITLDLTQETQEFRSGFPAKPIKKFITGSNFSISGAVAEMNGFNLSRVLGIDPITSVQGSPTTTITTGTTASVLKVASTTGIVAGDELGIGAASPHTVATVDTVVDATTLNLVYPLATVPANGLSVKKIDKIVVPVGLNGTPKSVSLKASVVLERGTLDIFVFKAQSLGNLQVAYNDNGGNQVQQLGFQFDALADSAVEGGALASWQFAPNG